MFDSGIAPDGLAASVLLTDERGRVLLVRHAYGLRRYALPGGVVEAGEAPEGAAVREALEEIGVEVELGERLGTYLVHGSGRPSVLSHVFIARVKRGSPHVADPREIAVLRWADPGEPPAPLTNDARVALGDYLGGGKGHERVVARVDEPRAGKARGTAGSRRER